MVMMDHPQLYTRRSSLASSQASSFESRSRSPLSITSSIDYQSSLASDGSLYSQADTKPASISPASPLPFNGLSKDAKRSFTEPVVPVRRHGQGGHGRPQVYTTLITPQRLSRGPGSPTSPTSPAHSPFGVRYKPRVPGAVFRRLPEEILLVILGKLKNLHLEAESSSCATCWMRDLVSLSFCTRKWRSATWRVLYEDIILSGADSTLHTKKYKIKYGVRLKLLRRTLRARPDLAQHVKSLKVPSMPAGAKGKKEQAEYLDLVATLIMVCPNLERLPGFYPTYNHTFSRFVHAVSTRPNLKEAVWVINPDPSQRQHRYTVADDAQPFDPLFAPAALLPEQCVDFLTYHSNWSHLKTLVLHGNPGGTIDSLLFADICNHVPSIENLHVSSFPAPAFNDSTLASLPPLKSLRLENLPGVTANGISNYACLASSNILTSLSLVNLPLVSLPVLARVFSHLESLTHFTLLQAHSPGLPIGTEIYLHPYLVSQSLEYLHWEITDPDDDKATDILAKSISFSGFPSLRTIRAPTDFHGSFQKLCKPREKIEMPSLGSRGRDAGGGDISPGWSPHSMPPPSPTWTTLTRTVSPSFLKSPRRSSFSHNAEPPAAYTDDDPESRRRGMSLYAARRMAQQRIEAAQVAYDFHIIIWNEKGKLVERHTAGGFIGSVRSRITYSLKPDVAGADEAVRSIEGPDGLLDESQETDVRDGCIGAWNQRGHGRPTKSVGVKEGWWHTERGRWRDVGLEKLFR